MTTKRQLPTFERVHELLRYEAEAGKLFWKKSNSNRIKVGGEAGSVASNGYRYVGIDGKLLLAHRVVFFMQSGKWPSGDIDHKDGDRLNNAWDNLRECNRRTNNENRKRPTGAVPVLGVSISRGRYKAQIQVDGRNMGLGRYNTINDAEAAYLSAKRRMHEGYVA